MIRKTGLIKYSVIILLNGKISHDNTVKLVVNSNLKKCGRDGKKICTL